MKSWLKIVLLLTFLAVMLPLFYRYLHGNQAPSNVKKFTDQSHHRINQVLLKGEKGTHKHNKLFGAGKRSKVKQPNHFDNVVKQHHLLNQNGHNALNVAHKDINLPQAEGKGLPKFSLNKKPGAQNAKRAVLAVQEEKKTNPSVARDPLRQVKVGMPPLDGGVRGGRSGRLDRDVQMEGALEGHIRDSLDRMPGQRPKAVGERPKKAVGEQPKVVGKRPKAVGGGRSAPLLKKKTAGSFQSSNKMSKNFVNPPPNQALKKFPSLVQGDFQEEANSFLDRQQLLSQDQFPRQPPPPILSKESNPSQRVENTHSNKITPQIMFKKEQTRLNNYLKATNQEFDSLSEDQQRFFLGKPCSDLLCSKFLPKTDINFTTCLQRAQNRLKSFMRNETNMKLLTSVKADPSNKLLASGECRFMNGSGRDMIGLVSFPGSGNTWVRGLLQRATGICTGAVYCDIMLRLSGFDGEVVQSSSALVIKSHGSTPQWTEVKGHFERGPAKGRPNFDSVIFVFRNPYDAIVSEWNRQLSTKYRLGKGKGFAHTARYGLEYFGDFKDWIRFVNVHIKAWSSHFNWIISCHGYHKILVVQYEDLKQDSLHEVKRMLDFLQFPYTDSDLHTRLEDDFNVFHRSGRPEFDPFSPTERKVVATAISDVISRLKEATGQTFGVEEYQIVD